MTLDGPNETAHWKRSSIIHDVSDTLIPTQLKKWAEKPHTKKLKRVWNVLSKLIYLLGDKNGFASKREEYLFRFHYRGDWIIRVLFFIYFFFRVYYEYVFVYICGNSHMRHHPLYKWNVNCTCSSHPCTYQYRACFSLNQKHVKRITYIFKNHRWQSYISYLKRVSICRQRDFSYFFSGWKCMVF